MNWKRMLVMVLLVVLLMTDQSYVYAVAGRTEADTSENGFTVLTEEADAGKNYDSEREGTGTEEEVSKEEESGDSTDDETGLGEDEESKREETDSEGDADSKEEDTGAEGDSGTDEGDTGAEGDSGTDEGDTGAEGDSGTGEEDTGAEGDSGTGEEDTGSEGDSGTGEEDTGAEGDSGTDEEDTGAEGDSGTDEEDTGSEGDSDAEGDADSKEDSDAEDGADSEGDTDSGEGETGSKEDGSGEKQPDGAVLPEEKNPSDESEILESDISKEEIPSTDTVILEKELIQVSTLAMNEITEQVYTGQEICPELVLKDGQGNILKAETHYTVVYSNNIDAGQASFVVSGAASGGYTGTLTKNFTIQPCNIGAEDIIYGGLDEDYPYTGKKVVPELVLSRGGITLQEGKDYSFSCSSNVEIGTGKITVKGLGNYTGKVEKSFKITKRSMTSDQIKVVFTDGKSSFTYNGKSWKPEVTVTYGKKKLEKGTDYTVSYSKNKNAGTAKVKITGKGIYSGSCTKNFKIKPVNVNKLKITKFKNYSYLNAADIDTKVKFGSVTLKKDKDYTILFKSKIKNGKNTVTVKGTGNFTGSKKMTVQVTFSSKDKVSLTYCKASSWKESTGKLTVRVKMSSMSKLQKLNSTFYIVQLDSRGEKTRKRYKASFSGKYLQAVLKVKDGGKTAMMSQYAVAVKIGSKYQIITKKTSFITNPEKTAVMTEPYNGYYDPEGKVTSKKGIQGASEDYLEDLGAQHVLLNMDLAALVSTKKKSGYVSYSYNGKTYYFQNMTAWKQTLRYLNGWDEDNPYGWHRRSVTVVLLLSWKSDLKYLIHPSARKKGVAHYYTLNMKDKKARETFEALFCYLGEQLGDNKKSRACNWVLGNEVNCCEAWNYSGKMSLNDCVENYAKAFQLLNQGIRRTASTSRMFISLDHSWSASNEGHSGKKYLDAFAAYMDETAPKMGWNVNYHPYSQPLTRTDFWNDSSNTSGSSKTQYISMNNIKVLTDYLGKIEKKYGKDKGSIRVILGEQGFTALKGIKNQERKQAAALGYGYYIAMFNSRVDAYMIRSYLDDPMETEDGLYLGLMNASHEKKQSYEVYKYIDTDQSLAYMNQYLPTIEISSWKKKISNFKENKLSAGDF